MKIRQFEKRDLPEVLAIQAKNPWAAQWPELEYSHLAADPRGTILVAELETMEPAKVLGFAAFYRIIDEAELRNIAVDPAHYRLGPSAPIRAPSDGSWWGPARSTTSGPPTWPATPR